jgi:hypothetical protein
MIWSSTGSERIFENAVLKGMFGTKSEVVTMSWRKFKSKPTICALQLMLSGQFLEENQMVWTCGRVSHGRLFFVSCNVISFNCVGCAT